MDRPGTSKQGQDVVSEDLSDNNAKVECDQIHNIFNKLKRAIEKGEQDTFKKLVNILHTVNDKALIQEFTNSNDFDLFCLIGQHCRGDMLDYLLDQTQILSYLSPVDKAKRDYNIQTMFSNCMINGNTTLLEKFYDHWAGDLHWTFNKTSSITDNENLYNLCILLNKAKTEFQKHLRPTPCDPQCLADIHCIITYNEFQIQLYEKLHEVKAKISGWEDVPEQDNTIREIEAIKEIIEIIVDLHEKYSKGEIFKPLCLPPTDINDISFYREATLFYMYKTFFWKIDYNLCILVLDNLFILKKRLRLKNNVYQNLESMLYRFIHHFKRGWSFYLSKTGTHETDIIATQDDGETFVYETYTLDVGGMMRFSIMYLEQKHFLETLRSFKEELRKPILEEDIRPKDEKFADDEIQPLLQFPELRDDFSLKKMWRYLQELPSMHDIKNKKEWAYLLLERILQVVGEFLKSTKETMNLEPTTLALIMAEVPIDVVKSFNEMRNILCKQKDIRILWRMEIAKHGESIFEKLLQDLLYLKDAIKKVISINRYLVNKSLVMFGFKILHERNDFIKENIGIPDYLYSCYSIYLGGLLHHQFGKMLLGHFYEEEWSKHNLSNHLMIEVGQINHDFEMLLNKKYFEIKRLQTFVSKNFYHYKQIIEHLLDQVVCQLNNWTKIKSILKDVDDDIEIGDYPNHKDFSELRCRVKEDEIEPEQMKLNNCLQCFTDIDLLWDLIERLFEFLIKKTKCFDETVAELKFNMFGYNYRQLCDKKYKTADVKSNVQRLLKVIEDNCKPKPLNSILYNNHKFEGIKEYAVVLNMKQFVTEEEKHYIVTNIPDSDNNKKYIIDSIGNDFFNDMGKNVKTISTMVPFDKVSEKIIRNASALDRDPELLQCYYKRICLLSSIIDRQPKDLLVARYKYDVQFRIWLEMILIDLLNISQKCKVKETLQKQNKLLTEINIRNVLAHGSPLLEVIGDVLDANDLPGEIVHKSLQFVQSMEAIQALVQLQHNNFPFIKLFSNENLEGIDDEDIKLLRIFQTLDKWRSYLLLIPEYRDHTTSMTKSWLEKNRMEKLELIEAVKTKDVIDNLEELLKRVDINAADDHGNAALHYAAWNGKVDILEDLINRLADINIQSTVNGMTALHYAALKGQTAAIDSLKKYGAKVIPDKSGDTYIDIAEKLVEAAKKRLEEKPEEVEFEADDFKLFDLDE